LGKKLQTGEFDTSRMISTYCIQDDPAVGMSIWETGSREEFEQIFSLHRPYHAEVLEITPVVTSKEAQEMLMKQVLAK
jgi:hypothetical protein